MGKAGNFKSGQKDVSLLVFSLMNVPLDLFKTVQTFALGSMRHGTGPVTRKVEGSGWSTTEDSIFPWFSEPELLILLLQGRTLVQVLVNPQFIKPCLGTSSSAGQKPRPVFWK